MKKMMIIILFFCEQSIFCMQKEEVKVCRRNSSASSPRVSVFTPNNVSVVATSIPDTRQLEKTQKKTIYAPLKKQVIDQSQYDESRPKT